MTHIDLAVAWDWEFDQEFLSILETESTRAGAAFRSVGKTEVIRLAEELRTGVVTLGVFLDRAAPDEEPYSFLVAVVKSLGIRTLNQPQLVHRAADKATMHLEFHARGIEVPYTIIISPYSHRKELELSLSELARLGRPFIIKPANTTGGGTGVILGAETLKDVIDSRQHHKNDKYLLQENIEPAFIDGKRAWFRVFFACGDVIACWWDDRTHIYRAVAAPESTSHGLEPLLSITRQISTVCRLNFFSTEIALTPDGRFVVVDYVNEICDMRLQSRHSDGVPDAVVREIAAIIVRESRRMASH